MALEEVEEGVQYMREREVTIGSVLEDMKRADERRARASELGNQLLEMLDVITDNIANKVVERLWEGND